MCVTGQDHARNTLFYRKGRCSLHCPLLHNGTDGAEKGKPEALSNDCRLLDWKRQESGRLAPMWDRPADREREGHCGPYGAFFLSNVRPDSCKEFFLSFSRLTLGKASGLPENSLRLVTAKERLHRSECGSGCGMCARARERGKRAVCAGVQRRDAERGSRGRVVGQSGPPGLPGLSWPERQSAGQFGRRQARAPDRREDGRTAGLAGAS